MDKIQKIIMKVWHAILPLLMPKDKFFGITLEQKEGDSHTIIKTFYCEGDLAETLKDTHLTYLK